jgi:hypothetical protein
MFKLISAIGALLLFAGACWLFWMVTYPLARRLGIFGANNIEKEKVDAKTSDTEVTGS